MVAPRAFPWSFSGVAVYSPDRVFLIGGYDPATKKNESVSYVFRWSGKWASKPFNENAASICVLSHPEATALVVTLNGRIIRGTAKGNTLEAIDEGREGPGRVGDMREIRAIDKRAYAVGMRRMVYRCDAPDKWSRIDKGVRCTPADTSEAGFNSIHGFAENDI